MNPGPRRAILATAAIGLVAGIGIGALAATPRAAHQMNDPATTAPRCWEDEAVVLVLDYVMPPGAAKPGLGMVGCVPVDNLPVTGYRPGDPRP